MPNCVISVKYLKTFLSSFIGFPFPVCYPAGHRTFENCLECNGIRFDIRERVAYAEENPVALTRKENGILEYLLLNQGRPVSQEELIEHVWDSSVDSFSGSIRVHMSSLRRKLKAGLGYDPIVNRIGVGYKIGGDGKA